MRSGVVVDDTHEHLAHDQRADRSEPLTVLPRLGLLEDVVPQWCLAGPAVVGQPGFLGSERLRADRTGDRFSGRQRGCVATQQIPYRQRAVVGVVERAGDVGWQVHE